MDVFERNLRPIVERFANALHRSLPALDRETFAWRLHYAIGAMVHTMACRETVSWISGAAAGAGVGRRWP